MRTQPPDGWTKLGKGRPILAQAITLPRNAHYARVRSLYKMVTVAKIERRMNYKKNKSAVDYLEAGKWGKFLMSVPVGTPRGYVLKDANKVQIIRIRASQMSKNPDCDRTFLIGFTEESGVLTVTATIKQKREDGVEKGNY